MQFYYERTLRLQIAEAHLENLSIQLLFLFDHLSNYIENLIKINAISFPVHFN